MSVKISKCSCCEEEEECATCDLESCEYAICKTCLEQQKNYGALESHLSGPQHKEAYSVSPQNLQLKYWYEFKCIYVFMTVLRFWRIEII